MTVSTEVSHNEYTGNGVTTTFPYTFRILNKDNLVVQTLDTNGNITTLVMDTNYTVTGAGSYSGGNIILPAPLANGWLITIDRELDVVQETDLRNQGKFFAEVHENAFDYLTMLIQQCFGWTRRALLKPNFLSKYYDAKQNQISNLADPTKNQDATTKIYSDTLYADFSKKADMLQDAFESGMYGYITMDSFQAGATLTLLNQVLRDTRNGEYYRWDGSLPKVVPPGSIPETTGGIGLGAWVSVGDAALRGELGSPGGADLVHWRHLNEKSLSMSVSSRLRKKIYASDFGVTASTTPAFNLSAMQAMVDDSATLNVAAVFDVSCSLSYGVVLRSNCVIFIPRNVTIKVADGVDGPVLTQGVNPGLTNVYVEGGVLDGNQQNAPRTDAVSVMDFGVCSNIVLKGITAKNGSGYGFAFQARPQAAVTPHLQGIAKDVILDSCHAINNGTGRAAGGDTYDGFDIKYVEGCIITECSAIGNIDKGFDPRGDRIFMSNLQAISNGSHGFGFSASYSDTGHAVKGSFLVSNLFADSNGQSSFYCSEGVTANTVRYSLHGTNLLGKQSGTNGFRIEAQNADILATNVELRGAGTHGIYITSTSVNSCNISNLLVRGVTSNGIVVDPGAAAPIQFNNIDVIANAYGAAVYSPEAVIFNGGRLSGSTNGPIRVDAAAANPIMTGIVDGDITYKKGDVINSSSSTIALKLGLERVIVSSTSNINSITPMLENREVSLVSSGNVTYQNSSQMQLKTSPVTIADGMVIKFIAIGGKWRQI